MKNLLKNGSLQSVRNIIIALIAVFAIFTMVGCSSNSSSSGTDGSKSSVIDDVKNATGIGGKVVDAPDNLADFIATVEAAGLKIIPGLGFMTTDDIDGAVRIDEDNPEIEVPTFFTNVEYQGILGTVKGSATGYWAYKFPEVGIDSTGDGGNIGTMLENKRKQGKLP